MKKNIFLTVVMMMLMANVAAQNGAAPAADRASVEIRYVSKYGAYANDGKTWATAKNNVQDAINDLVDNGLTGEVWVARGTYTPTESTEKTGGSTLYMAFQIPAGITVRGGFYGKAPAPQTGGTMTVNGVTKDSIAWFNDVMGTSLAAGAEYPGETSPEQRAKLTYTQNINSQDIEQDWTYVYPTTLSGNLSTKAKFEWNENKQYWDASFYGNCYHVVWFATNGFDAATGRANALDTSRGEAAVEGFTIENGNARNTDLTGRFHNAYGGGAYMVWGSRMENCRVVNCEASRDGGGVYMDGGGVIKHCYVANNQALGIGVQFGYGGGVCLDANGRPDRYEIYRSAIVGNVGRMGGGLAIKVENPSGAAGYESIPDYYRAFVSAVLVGNNTATTEGGGVYTLGGGAMTNLSVVMNRCNGSGITSNGMQTGRAGGMYCRDHAVVLNSVFWGNDCKANNDIQFAATKSASGVANVDMRFCALEKSDMCDWTSTSKQSVFSLSEYNDLADFLAVPNNTQASENDIFPNFLEPASTAGYYEGLVGGILQRTCWIPGPNSGLANAGIVSLDLNTDATLPFVAIPTDILDRQYNSRSTLGAYTRKFGNMKPVKAALCDNEGNPNGTKVEAWHFFVDPNASTGSNTVDHGTGWHDPARYLGNVLHTIDSLRSGAPNIPAEYTLTEDDRVFVHVKEGTMNTTNSYASGRVRNISLAVPSNVVILGGYPEQLTQTNLTQTIEGTDYRRNPLWYPTYITGEIISGEYDQNAARLLTLNTGVKNVIIDGLNLRYANARSAEQGNTIFDGGGISMRGVNNVKVRNTIIAGCTANSGSAVYVEDGVDVEFENCIFHNNEALKLGTVEEANVLGGVVYVGKKFTTTTTTTTFKHCNILNNVGYGISLTEGSYQNWYNSVAFANMTYAYLKDKLEVAYLPASDVVNNPDYNPANDAVHNAFLEKYVAETFHTVDGGELQNIRIYNCFHDGKREKLSDDLESSNDYNSRLLLYYLNTPRKYPRFINGIVNAGVSLGGDRTFYGRATSFEPHNENPMVNAATYDNTKNPLNDAGAWGYDMSGVTPRTYGGLPDVGAIENHADAGSEENAYKGGQQAYGDVIYVRENGDDTNSGMSWDEAVKTPQVAIEIAAHSARVVGSTGVQTINSITPVTGFDELNATDWFKIHSNQTGSCWWTINGTNVIGVTTEPNQVDEELNTLACFSFVDLQNAGNYYECKIKTYTGSYLQAQDVSNNSYPALTFTTNVENATTFRVYSYSNNRFRIAYNTSNRTYYLSNINSSNTNIAWNTTSTSNTNYWLIKKLTISDGVIYRAPDVWIAEGNYVFSSQDKDEENVFDQGTEQYYLNALYSYKKWNDTDKLWELTDNTTQKIKQMHVNSQYFSICMREGVDVFGGFPATGYPGDDEREPKKFATNISPSETPVSALAAEHAASLGRAMVQKDDFTTTTVLDGVKLTNAYLHSTYRHNIHGEISTIYANTTNSYYVGYCGGVGAYVLDNCVLENCEISGNISHLYPGHSNITEIYGVNQTDGGYHQAAAGVFLSGGELKNCIIKDNVMEHALTANSSGTIQSAWMYGAGIYMNTGTVYNTIITGNKAKIVEGNRNPAQNAGWHEVVVGAGALIVRGNFFNNTVVYNHATTYDTNMAESKNIAISGIYVNESARLYNCIVSNNEWEQGNNTTTGGTQKTVSGEYQICFMDDSYTPQYSGVTAQFCYIGVDVNSNAYNVVNPNSAGKNFYKDQPLKLLEKAIINGIEYPYTLDAGSPCINTGTFDVLDINGNNLKVDEVTDYDAAYTERVKDCTIDIGAYEYNDSYAISPDLQEDGKAIFYVTPDGLGMASGADPANAACADKLQKVLDAAGRYKYANKDRQVIVKVAYSKQWHDNDENFRYYATRSTDTDASDVRQWSIIVPRGIEVWGGYSDNYASADNTGFYRIVDGKREDLRDITEYPTYFDSYYSTRELPNGVYNYHVVTFTEQVFDGDGKPYKQGDALQQPSTYTGAEGEKLMSMGSVTSDRAVIDGIFITGGRADVKTFSSTSANVNINSYGGAAIVTDYAHVRNCIVRNNQGIYGGALALTHGALVTGCLIEENTADYGGAIYVFADGTTLSDGTPIDSKNKNYDGTKQDNASRYDLNMAHVLSSTIVNNRANVQGGGVWFTNNVRFNSVALWQNICQDQANVRGEYNVTRPDNETYTTTEYYPFNYSAVQDVKPSGLNNINLQQANKYSTRFYSEEYLNWENSEKTGVMPRNNILATEDGEKPNDFARMDDFTYYVPSDYSVLVHTGMPVSEYNDIAVPAGISTTDILGMSRSVSNTGKRTAIEIGAIASDKTFAQKDLMLRLFVSQPEDVNVDAALAMHMADLDNDQLGTSEADEAKKRLNSYYSQEGSSFAYPFQTLQDALNYIYVMRGLSGTTFDKDKVQENANNMSFEIFLGPGTYYPTADLTGLNNYAVANTFLIPEGVSLVGGHNPKDACDYQGNAKEGNHFLGAYAWAAYKAPNDGGAGQAAYAANSYYVDLNKTPISEKEFVITDDKGVTYTLHHVDKTTANTRRELSDINANSVVEPWEFANQTVLSGKVEGAENTGVNHIVTIIADERYTGMLPTTQGDPDVMFPKNNLLPSDVGYMPHEHGQIVAFDGLTFTGGYAYGYKPNSMDKNHKMKYNNGGAILVDANRYFNSANHPDDSKYATYEYKHGSMMGTAGYREIPVMINRCKFENNLAGFGGAISTNTTLDVVNSSFEHNRALAGEDIVDYIAEGKTTPIDLYVKYPGVGGAIYATYQVTAMNTIFANNEAVDPESEGLQNYTILSDLIYTAEESVKADAEWGYTTAEINANATPRPMIAGSGGSLAMARKGHFHFLNCNFVRNAANAFPAIFTVNPNYNRQLTPLPYKTYVSTKDYNQALNCVFWGNELTQNAIDRVNANSNLSGTQKEAYLWGLNKVVNYGNADRWNGSKNDVDPYDLGGTGSYAWTKEDLNDESKFTETIWFSAYEKDKGKEPVSVYDMRDMTFTPRVHVKQQIIDELAETGVAEADKKYNATIEYQNCNVALDPANAVTEGPNFVNPSTKAGYEGYMESADWSPARINRLTDSGWGKIKQVIVDGEAEFVKYDGTTYKIPTTPADRAQYSSESDGSDGNPATYVIEGAYSAIRYMRGNEKYQLTMPIGTQEYMYSSFEVDGKPVNYHRISYDPNPTHNQTYIDMGVYEYYHSSLTPDVEGDEVDVLWVSAIEKDDALATGESWDTPTSDLQRAIETLLSSRNGHRKEIRLLDGTFVPIYTIEGKLGFYIDTKYQNGTAVNPTTEGLGVQSLTIKGGYSSELEGERDVDEYPAIIRQQVRTDGGQSDRWNHLFYIKDPTQRYGLRSESGVDPYKPENGYGHIYEDNKGITSIPIEFDGVTLVNDQAQPGTVGSVIHYAGLTPTLDDAITAMNSTDNSKKSNYEGLSEDYKIKPVATNVTVQPKDGVATTHYWAKVDPAKITLSKTKVYGSGKATSITTPEKPLEGEGEDVTITDVPSAVYLGDAQGGHAVLYNNVMHSNTVNPLVSGAKTLTVNNTFALNAGKVWLDGNGSTIHNSVLWMNNENKSADVTEATKYGAQFYLAGFGASNEMSPKDFTGTLPTDINSVAEILSNNAYTNSAAYSEFLTNSTDYSATGEVSQYAYNTALYSDNTNFMLGPNFTDPDNADVSLRDFTLLPSMRLMNRGLNANYDTLTVSLATGATLPVPEADKDKTGVELTSTHATVNGKLLDLAYNTTYNEDAATNPRFMNTIDLGAYEYQKRMRRVIYVDPNSGITTKDDKSGESWENPIGREGLQDAVDLAALYYSNNVTEQAFVFVRGTTQIGLDPDNQVHTGEDVTLRNGVSVYGGIRPSFVKTCVSTTDAAGTVTHADSDINNYLKELDEDSEGYIGPNTHRTAVTGIKTNQYTVFNTDDAAPTGKLFRIESFIKGFHVTPVNANSTVTAPVIDIDPHVGDNVSGTPKVALSHITVYGNNASNAEPVAKMRNSLIYGSIFRDNATQIDDKGTTATNDDVPVAVLRLDKGAYAVSVSVQGATESDVAVGDAATYERRYLGYGKEDQAYEKTTRIINSIVNYDGDDPEYAAPADTLVTAQTKYTFSGWNYRRNDRNMYFQLAEGSKHINEIELVKGSKWTSTMDGMPENLKAFVDYQTDRDILGNPRLLTLKDGVEIELLDRGAFETWKIEKDTWTSEHNHGTGGSTTDAARDHFSPHTGSVVYIAENKKLICGTDFQPGFLLLKDGASLYGNGHNVKVSFVAVEREIAPNGSVVSLPFEMDYSEGENFSDGVARSYYVDANGNKTHNMNGILHLDWDDATEVYDYDPVHRSEADYDFSPTSGAWKNLATQRNVTTKAANQGVLIVPAPEVREMLKNKVAPYQDGKLIYSFTSMGATWYNNVYAEDKDENFKEVSLTQNDDRTSTDGGADFTSKEDMGWNLIGLPYLVSEYKTYDTDYAKAELGSNYTSNVYNMDIPHTMWLYYDGKTDAAGNMVAPDGSEVDGDGGFYSVDSWSNALSDWHVANDADKRIWWGEGIFTQTASVSGQESLKFYRPVAPTDPNAPVVTPDPNPARTRGNKRYYVMEQQMEEEAVVPVCITVDHHTVTITGLEGDERISIFDASGRIRLSDRAGGTDYSTTIPESGVYIIRVNNLRQKVLVK